MKEHRISIIITEKQKKWLEQQKKETFLSKQAIMNMALNLLIENKGEMKND